MRVTGFLSLLILTAFFADCKKKPAAPEEFRYVAASSGLRLRKSPDLKADKIATIGNGGRVRVIEAGEPMEVDGLRDRWLQVEFGSQRGWAFGGYLTKPTKKSDSASEKFMGYWHGKYECKNGDRTHLVIHPDGTYNGWLADAAGAQCTGHAIQGTWKMEQKNLCFVDPDRACFDQAKGILMAIVDTGALRESGEIISQMKR